MVICVLFAAVTAAGQAPKARPQAKKAPAAKAAAAEEGVYVLRSVTVTGLKHYTLEDVLPVLGLRVEQRVRMADLEKARDRLLATDCFEGVGWKYALTPQQWLEVTFEVTEPEQFLPWMLDRVAVTREEFEARARKEFPLMREKLPPSGLLLERLAAVLEKLAAEKGVKEPMAGRVTLVGKDQLTIVFGPKAPPPNIADVRFVNTKAIRADYLQKEMVQLAVGTPYFEPNFRFLLENQIRPIYDSVGRLKAGWTKITAAPAEGVFGVVVTVEVDEGPVFKLEKIHVRGTPFPDDEIQEMGQFPVGGAAAMSEIGKGILRVLDRLKEKGYMKASYKATRRLWEDRQTVELFVDVDPGPVYTMGRLQIKGLDLESEPAIRKLWAIKTGEPYRGGYAAAFAQRIREMDLFDFLSEIKQEERVDEKSRSVDVVLVFVGEKPKPAPRRPY